MASDDDSWTMDDVTYRRCDVADRDDVISINDDIYGGFDYLPGKYTQFCHSGRYIMYAAELKGKLVAFMSYYILERTPGRVELLGAAGRVRDHLQGRGIMSGLSDHISAVCSRDYPGMISIGVANFTPTIQALVERGERRCIQTWNQFRYRVDRRVLADFVEKYQNENKESALYTPGVCEMKKYLCRHFRRISELAHAYGPYIISENCITPDKITMENLNRIFTSHHVIYTVTGDRKGESVPSAFSLSTATQVKYSLRCDIYYYGSAVGDFMSHVRRQVETLLRGTRYGRLGLVIHFPASFSQGARAGQGGQGAEPGTQGAESGGSRAASGDQGEEPVSQDTDQGTFRAVPDSPKEDSVGPRAWTGGQGQEPSFTLEGVESLLEQRIGPRWIRGVPEMILSQRLDLNS